MRAQDDLYLKRARAEQEHLQRMQQYDELIRPAMVDLHGFLKKRHQEVRREESTAATAAADHLSARQLEALARWKLGLDVTSA
jgi:hypothetical protein